MPEDRSSFMITHLLDGLGHVMTSEESSKLDPYRARAAEAGSVADDERRRAHRCAVWSEELVSQQAHSHLAAEIDRTLQALKQIREQVEGAVEDAGLVFLSGQETSLSLEEEITWVYDAVHVADRVAKADGWDAVPWEGLVEDLLKL